MSKSRRAITSRTRAGIIRRPRGLLPAGPDESASTYHEVRLCLRQLISLIVTFSVEPPPGENGQRRRSLPDLHHTPDHE
jgi:hypothetical protein